MKRKTDIKNGSSALPIAGKSDELPTALEYTPRASMEKWRVERFDLMAAEFEMSAPWEAAMQSFHEYAAMHARTSAWVITRRLFGIMPLIPSGELHPDDLRVNTREEVCASLALNLEQLKAELDFLRAGYATWAASPDTLKGGHQTERLSHPIAPPGNELELDDKTLKQFGFSERMFKIQVRNEKDEEVARSEEENRIERDWFCQKLAMSEWQKMLSEPLAATTAREALINELYLRRLQQEMMMLSPASLRFEKLSKTQSNIEGQHRDQLERLQEKFPEMAIAGKVSFRGCVSDLILAHRQYYGKKDRRLWDKVHTAAEIVFLLRQSSQLPSARYRLGWQAAVVEAIHGLCDPDFRSQLKKSDLKKLDMGMKAGIDAARQELGQILPNLEKGVLPEEGEGFEDHLAVGPSE